VIIVLLFPQAYWAFFKKNEFIVVILHIIWNCFSNWLLKTMSWKGELKMMILSRSNWNYNHKISTFDFLNYLIKNVIISFELIWYWFREVIESVDKLLMEWCKKVWCKIWVTGNRPKFPYLTEASQQVIHVNTYSERTHILTWRDWYITLYLYSYWRKVDDVVKNTKREIHV